MKSKNEVCNRKQYQTVLNIWWFWSTGMFDKAYLVANKFIKHLNYKLINLKILAK